MPKCDLRISLVQANLAWEDPATNREYFSQICDSLIHATDIIILPEMYTTGFTLDGEGLAEAMSGPSVQWMLEQAGKTSANIAGSLIVREQGHLYNRLIWAKPDGDILTYDKRHLFGYAKEDTVYTAGTEKLLVELKGWKIMPLICYDLRFPVWSVNLPPHYDLAIYVANWPEPRSTPWQALLVARAIENLAYVAGVNRIGEDGNGLVYSGKSAVFSPQGETIHQCNRAAGAVTVTLSGLELSTYRKRFPALYDIRYE